MHNVDGEKGDDESPTREESVRAFNSYQHVCWKVSGACKPQLIQEEIENKIRTKELEAYQNLKPTIIPQVRP